MTGEIFDKSAGLPVAAWMDSCVRPSFVAVSALHWVVTIFPVWLRSSAQSESFLLSDRLMSTRMRLSRSSRTQSITPLRRAAWWRIRRNRARAEQARELGEERQR